MGWGTALQILLKGRQGPCAHCGAGLGLKALVDSDGRPFCPFHGRDALCVACGRVGGQATSVGIRLCTKCASQGVLKDSHARGILERVQKELGGLGFRVMESGIPIHLVTANELARPGVTHEGRREGLVNYLVGDDGTYQVQRILVQKGLPPCLSGRIVAHELGHVWLLQEGTRQLTPQKEEGFCEFCAWLWMNRRSSPEIAYRSKVMEESPDPVYGAGFREAKGRFLRGGVPFLLSWLSAGA